MGLMNLCRQCFFYNQVYYFPVQIGHIDRENTLDREAFAWCLVQGTITIRKIQTGFFFKIPNTTALFMFCFYVK